MTTLNLAVNADAHEDSTGGNFSSSATAVRCESNTTPASRFFGGFYFLLSAEIPDGSTIDACYITVQPSNTSTDDPNVDITFENSADADDFIATADVTSRTRLGSTVQWTATGVGASAVNSPSLVVPMQALVDAHSGLLSGAGIMCFLDGRSDANSTLRIVSLQGTGTTAVLHIEFTAPTPDPGSGVSANAGYQRLGLQLLTEPGGAELADFGDAVVCSEDNGPHGFRSLECLVEMPLNLSFVYYDLAPKSWLVLSGGGGVVWEGRVEDRAIVTDGLRLRAFGAWRALLDVPYTALWSASGTAGWRAITNSENSVFAEQKYEMDNNNRLYIAPKKNEVFSSAGSYGVMGYVTPNGGGHQIVGIQFDLQMTLPTNWTLLLQRRSSAWGGVSTEYTLAGSGSLQSRSVSVGITGIDNLVFLLYYNAASATYTGETGDAFVKITNIRIVTNTANMVLTTTTTTISAGSQAVTPASMANIYVGQRLIIASANNPSESVVVTAVTSTTFTATFANGYSGTTTVRAHVIYADQIIEDLVSHVTAVNPGQLSTDTSLIQSPGVDLLDVAYEDALPADIATGLAALGDNQTPPRRWEVGVWEDRRLHFRPKGSGGRTWFIEVDEAEIESTLETLYNSAYGQYQDASNRTLRTAVADDADSQARYGVVRRQVVPVRTTSATQAGIHRDAALEDGRVMRPRSAASFWYLTDRAGAIFPKWLLRAGDTLVLANLPATASEEIDRARTFLVAECSYDAITNEAQPVPEEPPASLELLVARRDEGIG